MKQTTLYLLFAVAVMFTACSKDDDDPKLKNIRVCTELSNGVCGESLTSISPTESTIHASAELENVKDANVTIALWGWDGQDWQLLADVTVNNEDKNSVNATFTNNSNNWAETDYEIEFLVDDPELDGVVAFTVE